MKNQTITRDWVRQRVARAVWQEGKEFPEAKQEIAAEILDAFVRDNVADLEQVARYAYNLLAQETELRTVKRAQDLKQSTKSVKRGNKSKDVHSVRAD